METICSPSLVDYWLDQRGWMDCSCSLRRSSRKSIDCWTYRSIPFREFSFTKAVHVAYIFKDYVAQPWHQFLIYIFYNVVAFLINAFATRLLPLVTKGAFIWSISGFVIISITLLACSSPTYNSGDLVFRLFLNETGWPDGIAWLLGLLQGGLGLTGYDSVAHMIEEIPMPSKEGPKIMIYCVCVGLFTGFIFLVVLLLVSGPLDAVIDSSAGPVLQIFFDATKSYAGSACLILFPLICLLFATITIMTTSSRMTYAFAR
jgi:choline transport protein